MYSATCDRKHHESYTSCATVLLIVQLSVAVLDTYQEDVRIYLVSGKRERYYLVTSIPELVKQ